MQPVSFDCIGYHHIYIYIFMITINPFWSNSLRLSMPSPSLAHTHFKIYISSPSFTASAFFKIKLVWLSDVRFIPYDKRSLVPVAISISAPQYLLDVESWLSLPFGILIWCAVSIPMTKGHMVQCPANTPHFFLFLRMIPTPTTLFGSQKGPHPERWNLCFGEHIICISHAFHYQSPRAEFDSRQLLFAHLRKMVSQLP